MQPKQFLPAIFLTCLGMAAFGQDSSKLRNACKSRHQDSIVYDFKAGTFNNLPDCIREGNAVSIKYININPWAIVSSPTFTQINYNYSTALPDIQGQLGKISASTDATNALDAYEISGNDKNNKKPDDCLENFNKGLYIIYEKLTKVQREVIDLKSIMALDKVLRDACSSPTIYSVDELKQIVLESVNSIKIDDYHKITTVVKGKLADILNYSADISNNLLQLNSLIDTCKIFKSNDKLKKLLEGRVAEITSMNDKIKQAYDSDTSVVLTNAIILQSNFTKVFLVPFELKPRKIGSAKGDFIEFSDELKDKDGKVIVTIEPQRIRTYGGQRVNFSVGIATNIGGNGADYQFRKNPTDATTGPDTAKIILAELKDNKIIKFAPMVAMHWYRTSCRSIQTMLTIGLAPDFSTIAESRIFLGGGLGFPSSNDLFRRLVISAGLSIGYADKLKPEYQKWKSYNRFSDIDIKDMTARVPRFGSFFAVTFNLGSEKK